MGSDRWTRPASVKSSRPWAVKRDEVVAAYYCALDRQTPRSVRATLLAALAYFVMPFDIVPDLLAVVGFGDDIAVLTAALAAIRPHIKESHRIAARQALAEE